jgi:hypothetical protein
LLGLCTLTGCGGKETSDITGKVTYKGKALAYGYVNLISSDEKSFQGEIQSDGSYSIPKVPVGPAKIGIDAVDPKVKQEAAEMLKKSRTVGPDGAAPPKPTFDPNKLHPIPDAYNSPETSGLKVEVKKGTTTYNIDLTEKGP